MADSANDTDVNEQLVSGPKTPDKVDEARNRSPTHHVKSVRRKNPRGKSHKIALQIDLSKVKLKTTHHSKPSLPNPLTEYGLDEKKQARTKARHEARVHQQKKEKSSLSIDEEKDKEKEKQKEEKYLNVLDDLRKLRNYYYQEYKDLLDTKVEKQRKNIRSQNEAQQKRLQEQEERKRQATHVVKKRNEPHMLQHDEKYMKSVSKSDAYLILGLQEKMVKEGKLKCQDDLDTFWMEMRTPEIFIKYFPHGLAATSGIHSQMVEEAKHGNKPRHSLSHISESKESSRPTTHETWAVTQRFQYINQSETSPVLMAPKDIAQDLDRRFPKLEMPDLHCFDLDLGEKPPNFEQMRLNMELKIREKQRRRFLKKLHKMHQLAMANSAAATRILDKHTDLGFLRDGPELTDLISDFYWEDSYTALPPIASQEMVQSSVRPVQSVSRASILEEPPSSTSSPQYRRESKSEQQLVVYQPPKPLPLTMDEIVGSSRIMEAKALSTLWNNYMHAGKRVLVSS